MLSFSGMIMMLVCLGKNVPLKGAGHESTIFSMQLPCTVNTGRLCRVGQVEVVSCSVVASPEAGGCFCLCNQCRCPFVLLRKSLCVSNHAMHVLGRRAYAHDVYRQRGETIQSSHSHLRR
ncbi:unnamed protein product, partial [Phaeothamnion confervicola]